MLQLDLLELGRVRGLAPEKSSIAKEKLIIRLFYIEIIIAMVKLNSIVNSWNCLWFIALSPRHATRALD